MQGKLGWNHGRSLLAKILLLELDACTSQQWHKHLLLDLVYDCLTFWKLRHLLSKYVQRGGQSFQRDKSQTESNQIVTWCMKVGTRNLPSKHGGLWLLRRFLRLLQQLQLWWLTVYASNKVHSQRLSSANNSHSYIYWACFPGESGESLPQWHCIAAGKGR